jgi:hypothetical protein
MCSRRKNDIFKVKEQKYLFMCVLLKTERRKFEKIPKTFLLIKKHSSYEYLESREYLNHNKL